MKEYKFAHLTLEVEDTMRVAISEEEDFVTVLHKTENNEGGDIIIVHGGWRC